MTKSGTIQHVHETRSGHNFVGDQLKHGHKSAGRLSENTKNGNYNQINKSVIFVFFIRAGCYVNRAGRKTVRAGGSTLRVMHRGTLRR